MGGMGTTPTPSNPSPKPREVQEARTEGVTMEDRNDFPSPARRVKMLRYEL